MTDATQQAPLEIPLGMRIALKSMGIDADKLIGTVSQIQAVITQANNRLGDIETRLAAIEAKQDEIISYFRNVNGADGGQPSG